MSTLGMHAAPRRSCTRRRQPRCDAILLKAGAAVNAKNGLDTTALIWGALDTAKVRLLVDAGADVNARSKVGRTPLLVAASRPGSADAVRLLLAKGANPKIADVRGSTPLSEAARLNDLDTMKALLTNQPVDCEGAADRGPQILLRPGHRL